VIFDTGIYKLTNVKNDKIYIGQSKHIKRRLSEHRRCESKEDAVGGQSVIRRAIKKYGFKNFTFETLIYCDEGEYMDYMETKLIDLHECLVPNGYNVRDGGNKIHMSEEGKKRISEKAKKRIITEEHKNKVSEGLKKFYKEIGRNEEWTKNLSISQKGKTKSDKHKEKLSQFRKEYIKNNPDSVKNFLGKKHSDETKKIMSVKHLGFKFSEETKNKISAKAIGRKRMYKQDGSWIWSKP
jgi:group I intron endonuclease